MLVLLHSSNWLIKFTSMLNFDVSDNSYQTNHCTWFQFKINRNVFSLPKYWTKNEKSLDNKWNIFGLFLTFSRQPIHIRSNIIFASRIILCTISQSDVSLPKRNLLQGILLILCWLCQRSKYYGKNAYVPYYVLQNTYALCTY